MEDFLKVAKENKIDFDYKGIMELFTTIYSSISLIMILFTGFFFWTFISKTVGDGKINLILANQGIAV